MRPGNSGVEESLDVMDVLVIQHSYLPLVKAKDTQDMLPILPYMHLGPYLHHLYPCTNQLVSHSTTNSIPTFLRRTQGKTNIPFADLPSSPLL